MLTDCQREDCQIQSLGSSRTLLGWTPTYDKYGNLLNKDPNTIKTGYKCIVCNKSWQIVKRNGQETREDF